jgi:G protein-coupled receptor 157
MALAGENCTGRLDDLLVKPFSLRVTIEVVCILSAIGSGIIIFSYCCYREHRTRARYILVHLSVCNIGQVVSNFIGTVENFDENAANFTYDILTSNRSREEQLCTTQAFFTLYFSLCGMLWTVSLAVYLYLVILSMKQANYTKYFVWLSYLFCYGLPLLISVWLLLSSRLGYAPYSTPGYCGLVARRPFQMSECDPERDVYGEFLGYDLWIILTILVTLLFYSSALCHLKYQVSNDNWLYSYLGGWGNSPANTIECVSLS